MTVQQFLKALRTFRVQPHQGTRAPHKALLLLLALGKLRQHQPRLLPYQQWAQELTTLLDDYGRPGREGNQDTHDPYSLLCQTDKLWDIPGHDKLLLGKNGRPIPSQLNQTEGGLPEQIHSILSRHPPLLAEAAHILLNRTFPSSLHPQVLQDVGLADLLPAEQIVPVDDFRLAVLRAYEERCAICDYGIQMDGDPLGLEAAHIRWHAYQGPDDICNALALCAMHRTALDGGAISISDDYKLLVSPHLTGTPRDKWFAPYANQPIGVPMSTAEQPKQEYLQWHRQQVWRGDAN